MYWGRWIDSCEIKFHFLYWNMLKGKYITDLIFIIRLSWCYYFSLLEFFHGKLFRLKKNFLAKAGIFKKNPICSVFALLIRFDETIKSLIMKFSVFMEAFNEHSRALNVIKFRKFYRYLKNNQQHENPWNLLLIDICRK